MPIPQVVPDRAYNTRSVIDAYYGYPAVSEVLYPLDNNPLRLRVEFATVGPDLRPLPSRRQELFINNIMFEEAQPGRQYVCSEFIRSVTLGWVRASRWGRSATSGSLLSKAGVLSGAVPAADGRGQMCGDVDQSDHGHSLIRLAVVQA